MSCMQLKEGIDMGFWDDLLGSHHPKVEEEPKKNECKARETYVRMELFLEQAFNEYDHYLQTKPVRLITPDRFESDLHYQAYCEEKVRKEKQHEKAMVFLNNAKTLLTQVFYNIPVVDAWFKIHVDGKAFGIMRRDKYIGLGTYYGFIIQPWEKDMRKDVVDMIIYSTDRFDTRYFTLNEKVMRSLHDDLRKV